MTIREAIFELTGKISPLHSLERQHQQFTLQWIRSEAQLFRTQKPDIPNIHLVSYFVVINQQKDKILLGHHKTAQLWLPSGGHVENDELPQDTVRRECKEELNLQACFILDQPLFLTVTKVFEKGISHTDISLWFIIEANDQIQINYCKDEYFSLRWFNFDEIPYKSSDPHIRRFMTKLSIFFKSNLVLKEHSRDV